MKIEKNNIYNIECLEGMSYIEDKSIDMIFCDLPYGITTKNKWDNVIDTTLLFEQYNRIIKDNGVILLFGQDKFTAKMMIANEKYHRYNLIWNKVLSSGFLNANRQFLRQHEDIMVFYKKQPTYNPQKIKGVKCHTKGKAVNNKNDDILNNHNYGNFNVVETTGDMKFPTSILEFSKPHPSIAIHPTQKPIDLCRYLIKTYTNEDDLVLDNCCGCGTIPISAKLEGRNYIGMDNGICEKKNSEYFGLTWAEITEKRLKNLQLPIDK